MKLLLGKLIARYQIAKGVWNPLLIGWFWCLLSIALFNLDFDSSGSV